MTTEYTENLSVCLADTLTKLDRQIKQVEKLAEQHQCEPHELMSSDGKYFLTDLLVAKANVLCSLERLGVKS